MLLTLASVVAEEMCGTPVPVVGLEPSEFAVLHMGQPVEVLVDGRVVVG